MDPLQKQLKLIKNLLRSKNYQNFVKKLLNSENILLNENGKLIKFNLFNEDLYNYEFLDVYNLLNSIYSTKIYTIMNF